jgi:hypothetical protein
MATTGEKLVELSSLSTGTALEHLLAITTGGGGSGETIYVDRIFATVTPDAAGDVTDSISATVADDIAAELADDIEAELDDDVKGEIDP